MDLNLNSINISLAPLKFDKDILNNTVTIIEDELNQLLLLLKRNNLIYNFRNKCVTSTKLSLTCALIYYDEENGKLGQSRKLNNRFSSIKNSKLVCVFKVSSLTYKIELEIKKCMHQILTKLAQSELVHERLKRFYKLLLKDDLFACIPSLMIEMIESCLQIYFADDLEATNLKHEWLLLNDWLLLECRYMNVENVIDELLPFYKDFDLHTPLKPTHNEIYGKIKPNTKCIALLSIKPNFSDDIDSISSTRVLIDYIFGKYKTSCQILNCLEQDQSVKDGPIYQREISRTQLDRGLKVFNNVVTFSTENKILLFIDANKLMFICKQHIKKILIDEFNYNSLCQSTGQNEFIMLQHKKSESIVLIISPICFALYSYPSRGSFVRRYFRQITVEIMSILVEKAFTGESLTKNDLLAIDAGIFYEILVEGMHMNQYRAVWICKMYISKQYEKFKSVSNITMKDFTITKRINNKAHCTNRINDTTIIDKYANSISFGVDTGIFKWVIDQLVSSSSPYKRAKALNRRLLHTYKDIFENELRINKQNIGNLKGFRVEHDV